MFKFLVLLTFCSSLTACSLFDVKNDNNVERSQPCPYYINDGMTPKCSSTPPKQQTNPLGIQPTPPAQPY